MKLKQKQYLKASNINQTLANIIILFHYQPKTQRTSHTLWIWLGCFALFFFSILPHFERKRGGEFFRKQPPKRISLPLYRKFPLTGPTKTLGDSLERPKKDLGKGGRYTINCDGFQKKYANIYPWYVICKFDGRNRGLWSRSTISHHWKLELMLDIRGHGTFVGWRAGYLVSEAAKKNNKVQHQKLLKQNRLIFPHPLPKENLQKNLHESLLISKMLTNTIKNVFLFYFKQ